jgi:class 3 adenylate cyclase
MARHAKALAKAAMSATPVKRRLAAILAADAVGYSRLMGADEERTVRVLAAHRAVIDGIIAFHHGRIVNTAGDSVLAEFESAVEAVRCAVEIQDALKTRNDALSEDERMLFRIGVNLGDVMVSGDNLHGDGVNVAARLESVADPGGVSIASSVYDQIAGKLNLSFVDVGSRELKNIARPIHIYKLSGTAPAKAVPPAAPSRRPLRQAHAWGIAVIGIAIIASAGAWQFARPARAPAAPGMEVELTKARAEAVEAKRQLELRRAAQPKAESKARTQVKAPDEPKPSAQPAAIAHAPVKVEPAAAKPLAPEQKGFLPRWLWSSSPQKNP